MKKKMITLVLMAVVSLPTMAQYKKMPSTNAADERGAMTLVQNASPAQYSVKLEKKANPDIPEGYALVTLKTNNVWAGYDGTVIAQGGKVAAGMGGGDFAGGGDVIVYGGSLTAIGGEEGAGIGSGSQYRNVGSAHGKIKIKRRTPTEDSADAGIGGSNYSDSTNNTNKHRIKNVNIPYSGTYTIFGGTVTATGGEKAAGIGGGREGYGGDLTITGGTVIAKAGKQGSKGNRAIGPGLDSNTYGTLTIGDAMMVGAGNNGSVESIYDADERVNACWFRTYAEVSPCTHPSGFTYTIEGTDANGTHTSHCKHCGVSETTAHFNSDGTGTCICGYKDGEGFCTITIATTSNGSSYEGVGVAAKVGNNMPYTLPVCSPIPEGYDFAGWAVNPTNHNGIRPNGDEELKQAGENITVTENVSIFARYKNLAISLADNSDNAETLYNYNGKKNASVTLSDRTLYKDGGWNTLCLPFNVTIADSPLDGDGVDVRTLATSSFDELNGTLTLTFTPAEGECAVTAIEAGKPYIIKWTSGSDIVEPTFSGVTISNATTPVEKDYVDFVGTFSPIDIFTEDKTNLYLDADNLLYYPSGEDMTSFPINSFRAFFQLKEGLMAGELTSTETDQQPIKAFVLNFGEETGISEISDYSEYSENSEYSETWYSLDGRRIIDKPAAKGMYICGGRKVMIK